MGLCEGIYFHHVLFKTHQYATNDDKVSMDLGQVCVKDTQTSIQKIIFWIKKFKKGRLKWEKTCVINGLPP
jgi:hypothetical protein